MCFFLLLRSNAEGCSMPVSLTVKGSISLIQLQARQASFVETLMFFVNLNHKYSPFNKLLINSLYICMWEYNFGNLNHDFVPLCKLLINSTYTACGDVTALQVHHDHAAKGSQKRIVKWHVCYTGRTFSACCREAFCMTRPPVTHCCR